MLDVASQCIAINDVDKAKEVTEFLFILFGDDPPSPEYTTI